VQHELSLYCTLRYIKEATNILIEVQRAVALLLLNVLITMAKALFAVNADAELFMYNNLGKTFTIVDLQASMHDGIENNSDALSKCIMDAKTAKVHFIFAFHDFSGSRTETAYQL